MQVRVVKQRRPNPHLVKLHRSYTVEEVATLFGKHKNTVRAWIKEGLPTCDSKRPTLVLGQALRTFLQAKRMKNKKACAPDQLYCVRCREPRHPAGRMAEYQPVTEKFGNLIGICPVCDCLMNRRTSLAKIDPIRRELDITFMQARSHISETDQPSLNSDFSMEACDHENA